MLRGTEVTRGGSRRNEIESKGCRRPKPPTGVELSTLLTIRGREGAHRWLTETLGVPVKLIHVRAAASRREISCREVGGALMFST